MKRLWIITAALLAVALVGITAWHFWPTGDLNVSALYRQYEHQPGVRVGFVEGFAFNDSVRVDVPDERRQQLLAQGEDIMQSWPLDDGKSIAFLSRQQQALCIVQTCDDRQFEAVFMYHLEKLGNQ